MCTTTTNFGKIDTTIGNYEPIGFAYAIRIEGDCDFDVTFFKTPFSNEKEEELTQEIYEIMSDKVYCNVCNKRISYMVIVHNIDNNTCHLVGRDCGDGIANFGKAIDRINGKSTMAMKILKNKIQRKKFLSANIGLEECLKMNNKIIQSINEQFVRNLTLSEKQIELVFKLAEKQKEFDKQSELAMPITFDKLSNESLKVVSLKEQSSMYGDVIKILLQSDKGWKIYGNLPNSSDLVEVGDMVSFTCNSIKTSPNDKSFGFFSRAKIRKQG
jgi:hypothetical protein